MTADRQDELGEEAGSAAVVLEQPAVAGTSSWSASRLPRACAAATGMAVRVGYCLRHDGRGLFPWELLYFDWQASRGHQGLIPGPHS